MLFLLIWLGNGLLSAGMMCADLQRSFPTLAKENYLFDLIFSLSLSLVLGPSMLVATFFISGFGHHGWTLLPPRE